jgi:hypothetical protein
MSEIFRMAEPARIRDIEQYLLGRGTQFEPGLSDTEVDEIQQRFGFTFPPDFREFLQLMVPIGRPFIDWRGVTVHGPSRISGAGCWWRLASTAVQSHWNTERFCRRQVSETVSIRSMKRLPDSLWVPKDSLR